MKKNKLLLIGWDAADWQIMGPLLAKGEMPALKKIIDRGVYGNMSTMNPPYSPMLWSSVATGKTPDKHGVLGFIEIAPDLKGIRPVTASSRKTRAIWNILHNKGYKSNLVGWWPSYPAEPINGVVVTDKFQKVKNDPSKKNPIGKGVIHPQKYVKDLRNLRMFPFEVTSEHILPFIPKAATINQEKDKGLPAFSKLLAENVSIHCAATHLMRTTEWDFMAIYYDLIDHFCHTFMKYHPPKLPSIQTPIYEIYKDAVIGSYKFQDMMLERTMALVDDDTTVIIMSDHGFESGNKRIIEMPKYPAAPALDHRQFGMFVAAGPNIKKNEKVFGLGLIDIAPTILHHFNLPVGKDMDGKVALDIFKEITPPKYIESWDKVEGDFGEHKKEASTDQMSNQETLEQLIELGYIERPDEKIEIAILKTKCDLKHNLARVYLGKKDFLKANSLLLELVNAEYPKFVKEDKLKDDEKVGDSRVDKIPFYMDLLAISIQLKNYEQAEEYLLLLRKLKKVFKLNTYFAEAQILLGKEKVHEALEVLEKAKNRKPNSEVWYQIGKIYRRLSKYNEAKDAYEMAIKYESDKAKYHRALAEVYLRLGEYEEAADYALTSIELVKYFPEAHYTLGEALEKLGDLENAKKAYEIAASLKPKTFHRAEKAIENIEEKLKEPLNLNDKSTYKHHKDQIVIVSGLPRSGTSLMMQMLDKGGMKTLTDNKRIADDSNPKGYLEYEKVMSIHKDNSWLNLAKNKSVKVVAPLLKFINPEHRYKIIFMTRDLNEIVKSQQKMIGKDPTVIPVSLYNSYLEQLNSIEIWKNTEPGVELIYVDYNEIIKNPDSLIDKVVSFVGTDLNQSKMSSCIDKSLYRNKVKK